VLQPQSLDLLFHLSLLCVDGQLLGHAVDVPLLRRELVLPLLDLVYEDLSKASLVLSGDLGKDFRAEGIVFVLAYFSSDESIQERAHRLVLESVHEMYGLLVDRLHPRLGSRAQGRAPFLLGSAVVGVGGRVRGFAGQVELNSLGCLLRVPRRR